VRLIAADLMLSRGYGKPEVQADLTATHKFCIAPETLPLEEWLATKGQGYGRPPLLEGKATPPPPDAPTTLTRDPPDDADKLN
jgi:hypothetical protein